MCAWCRRVGWGWGGGGGLWEGLNLLNKILTGIRIEWGGEWGRKWKLGILGILTGITE